MYLVTNLSIYGIKLVNDKGWETGTVKLLRRTIDNELKFDEHIKHVCLKANRKLSALMRIRRFLEFNKTRMLFKGYFESQFKYCPLKWMCYSRNTNNKIRLLHERCLRCELPYNIHTLYIALHKGYQNIAQTIFSDLL